MRSTSEPEGLAVLRQRLAQHPLYARLRRPADLRIFMAHHVFAVWDFMSLAKRLQRELTGVTLPWLPPAVAPRFTRFINAIVLDEESDQDGRGDYISHFALYLDAMREIGADTGPILAFCRELAQWPPPITAGTVDTLLARVEAPAAAREFVAISMELALAAPLHQVAAAFFFGREDIIPAMFSALIERWRLEGAPVARFAYYLRRHIAVDADSHGPLARQLVEELCAEQPSYREAAYATAERVLRQRLHLWDAIADALEA